MQPDLTLAAVGLGPGDPELITIKGQRALMAADRVFVPRSVDGAESLALRIARPWLDTGRQAVVELALPMTRDPRRLALAWQAAADQIAEHMAAALAERAIVRGVYLLLGDPLLYGTFTYIWGELAARHPQIAVTIIPGITSFAATAARTQTVLGTTDDRIAIIPASYETDAGYLRRLLEDFETVVLMKVGSVMPQVLAALEQLGMLDAAIYAERVGMPEERIVRDVRTLQGRKSPYLSLLIVRRRHEDAKTRSHKESFNDCGEVQLIKANEGNTMAESGEEYTVASDSLDDFFASSPHASSPPDVKLDDLFASSPHESSPHPEEQIP